MKITFVGTGEAVDGSRTNTSLLVDDDTLLDCGYNVPNALVRMQAVENIDRIWISHFHGDHFAGTSALVLVLSDAERTRSFEFIGPKGVEQVLRENLLLHYGKALDTFEYPVVFTEIDEEAVLERGAKTFRFCRTQHKEPSFAVKIHDADSGKTMVHTADTQPTDALLDFFQDADFVVHECFKAEGARRGHSSADRLGKVLADWADPPQLAIVHCSRMEDRERIRANLQKSYSGKILLPNDGDLVEL